MIIVVWYISFMCHSKNLVIFDYFSFGFDCTFFKQLHLQIKKFSLIKWRFLAVLTISPLPIFQSLLILLSIFPLLSYSWPFSNVLLDLFFLEQKIFHQAVQSLPNFLSQADNYKSYYTKYRYMVIHTSLKSYFVKKQAPSKPLTHHTVTLVSLIVDHVCLVFFSNFFPLYKTFLDCTFIK